LSLLFLSRIRVLQKKLVNIKVDLSRSINIAEKLEDTQLILENYKLFSQLYESMGNYKKAFKFHKLYFDLNFKIYNEKTTKNIAQIEAKYQVEKREKENLILKKDNKIQALNLSKQVQIRNMAIVIIGLLFIILLLILKRYSFLLTFWKKKNYISHFKLNEIIGSGGTGVVYKATDIQNKSKTVALKVLRVENALNRNFKKRFKNEGAIIDRFDHPNIVKVIERGESGKTLYIAMELVKGRPLSEIIKKESPIAVSRVILIMLQISSAIIAIHRKSIVHRDLKPDNIMVISNEEGIENIKLLDFGIAKSKDVTTLTGTGSLLGTIHYLSPEQVKLDDVSVKSDIYSFGVIFYELITGKKLFEAESEEYILTKIVEGRITPPKRLRGSIPEEINMLIMNMLDGNIEKRPDISEIINLLSKIKKNLHEIRKQKC